MITSEQKLEQNILPAVPLLKKYWELLLKWQKSVNLISNNTIKDGWKRHILDSAQLYFLIEKKGVLMDVGSGGGLPGIVIAILNKALNGPLKEVILVESDLKKSLFLAECVRVLNLPVKVLRERVESISIEEQPDFITARAFAPLNELLKLIQKNVSRETILFLPKGKSVDDEIKSMTVTCKIEKIKSIINSEGCILKIREVKYE